MRTATVSTILVILLICAAGIPATTAAMVSERSIAVAMPVPEVVMEDSPDMDFSKLQISPRYSNTELMPGEGDKVTVTVTNKDNKTISVAPLVKGQPYSEYIFDETWVTVTPKAVELEPDAKEEFTIEVTIPDDADRGHYGVQIAFTDDVMPVPYPTPYPNYINAFDFHVSVWKPPVIQIQNSYIHDRVESDREYDYQINLKNVGEEDIEIDPKIGGGRMYRHDMMLPAFEDDAITITAPSVVPAGGTATVSLHLAVPEGAKGRYNGEIDLGIDDPSIDEWMGGVHLSFEVWTQPREPFVKTFTAETDLPITIEIRSEQGWYGECGSGSADKEEPYFDVTLEGPARDVTLNLSKVAYHGSVDLGGSGCTPPWEVDSSGTYHESHTSYIERYTVAGAVGDWTLGMLPHYAERFEYTITIGDMD
ncbi:MAG: hypothetical protein KAU52_00765 [Methanosarcinales archaeon]|nr:hypothetical protein [Methanosarcinales archaeon]